MDILHQLLKDIVMWLLSWTDNVVKKLTVDNWQAKREVKRKSESRLVKDLCHAIWLDKRFRQVPSFQNMKQFKHFSKVSQWTENKQKAIVKQLIPVLAPILTGKTPAAMHCARAILDFVMLAFYISHNKSTLGYMEAALYRLDKLKKVFKKSRPTSEIGEHHFNYPKLYVILHYADFI